MLNSNAVQPTDIHDLLHAVPLHRRAYLQSSRQGKGSKAGRGSSSTPDPDSDDSAEGADKVEQPKEKPKRKGELTAMVTL
jgi:hypothetical protein